MLSTWLNSLVAHAVVVGVRDDGQSEVHAKIKAWKETRMKIAVTLVLLSVSR